MDTLIINGRFFAQPLTGVQRFAIEILKQFAQDKEHHFIVALPKDAREPNVFSDNIEYVKTGKLTGNLWEQISLPKFCRKRKLPLLNTGNSAPVFYPSSVVLHDISFTDSSITFTNHTWRIKMKLLVRAYIYRSKNIFTVSDFSKAQILSHYPKLKKEPIVLGNGYEHICDEKKEAVENIPENFFLTLGSVRPHKNFRYILELAFKNPQKYFVICGGATELLGTEESSKYIETHHVHNLQFTGYLSDGQIKWLYEKCEGFILPSLYEGFGIPPLEAVACGCRKLFLSDIPVFREIYGDVANFFDPKDFEHLVPLETEKMQEESALKLLDRFTWKNAAQTILNTLFCDSVER